MEYTEEDEIDAENPITMDDQAAEDIMAEAEEGPKTPTDNLAMVAEATEQIRDVAGEEEKETGKKMTSPSMEKIQGTPEPNKERTKPRTKFRNEKRKVFTKEGEGGTILPIKKKQRTEKKEVIGTTEKTEQELPTKKGKNKIPKTNVEVKKDQKKSKKGVTPTRVSVRQELGQMKGAISKETVKRMPHRLMMQDLERKKKD